MLDAVLTWGELVYELSAWVVVVCVRVCMHTHLGGTGV